MVDVIGSEILSAPSQSEPQGIVMHAAQDPARY